MTNSEECPPWRHVWIERTNRYDQTYSQCRLCGKTA